MEKLKEKNRLIFIINLSRVLFVFGTIIFIQILKLSTATDILLTLGGVSIVYSLALLFLPLHKIKSKAIGYILCIIDSFLIAILIYFTGEFVSPFIILLFFPLLSLSLLYEIIGSTIAVFLFTVFTSYFLLFREYTAYEISNAFVKMALLALFSLYIGNIGKEIKSKPKLKKLEKENAELRAKLENKNN